MSAAKTAKELYDTYYLICQEFTEEIQCSIQAKQCALAALEFTDFYADEAYRWCLGTKQKISYLEEVKQELEKL